MYIPIAYASNNSIAGDKLQTIPNATLHEFGVITSTMHMAWMRTTAGRLESRYQYSAKITYNNFPWPVIASQSETWAKQSTAPNTGLPRRPITSDPRAPRNDKHVVMIEACASGAGCARCACQCFAGRLIRSAHHARQIIKSASGFR